MTKLEKQNNLQLNIFRKNATATQDKRVTTEFTCLITQVCRVHFPIGAQIGLRIGTNYVREYG